MFLRYLAIDYSGADGPAEPVSGIAVASAEGEDEPVLLENPFDNDRTRWSRKELAEWLADTLHEDENRTLVGIDHSFSLPLEFMLGKLWKDFIELFSDRWRTHERSVEEALNELGDNPHNAKGNELRLTEKWTSSARSVFKMHGQGMVGKSTHAGIPWLRHLRKTRAEAIHFWPFDGFEPHRKRHVVAEVYPALFKRRFPPDGETEHERDALATCRWMQERDLGDFLEPYFAPQLGVEDKMRAKAEGWILGVL